MNAFATLSGLIATLQLQQCLESLALWWWSSRLAELLHEYPGRRRAVPKRAYVPILILACGFRLLDALGLPLAALLVILARDRRHHLHQHRVDRAKHSAGELVTRGLLHSLMARRQIERNDAQALGVERSLELLPILHRKA